MLDEAGVSITLALFVAGALLLGGLVSKFTARLAVALAYATGFVVLPEEPEISTKTMAVFGGIALLATSVGHCVAAQFLRLERVHLESIRPRNHR